MQNRVDITFWALNNNYFSQHFLQGLVLVIHCLISNSEERTMW